MPSTLRYSCPLCGGTGQDLRDFAQRKDESLRLIQCEACSLVFLSPQPSDEWLAEEYAEYYARRGAQADGSKFTHFTKLLGSTNIDFNGRRVLDLGSGEGESVKALLELCPSSKITAVEGHPAALPFYKELNCTHLAQSVETWANSSSEERFEVALLFDLLEHLRDPLGILSKICAQALVPGGVIVATFPNVESASHALMRKLWPHFKVEHLFYFSKPAVKFIEETLALDRVSLRPATKSMSLNYFLNVGKSFGPEPTRKAFKGLEALVPQPAKGLKLAMPMGEYLWIAQKKN